MFRLISISALAVAMSFGAAFVNISSDAKPINTWGAICSSQVNQLDCCLRMLQACRQGCFERGNCLKDACEGHYNRCLQRRMQNSSTGVRTTTRPPASTTGQ